MERSNHLVTMMQQLCLRLEKKACFDWEEAPPFHPKSDEARLFHHQALCMFSWSSESSPPAIDWLLSTFLVRISLIMPIQQLSLAHQRVLGEFIRTILPDLRRFISALIQWWEQSRYNIIVWSLPLTCKDVWKFKFSDFRGTRILIRKLELLLKDHLTSSRPQLSGVSSIIFP